ncbi:MAG: hypothetical protein JWR19_3718 [Pedosphaera sp.]|nr:hypothetical protein [Pedosphaera sp.]
MALFIQDLIHRVEEGGGLRYLKHALLLLALLGIGVTYNLRGYRNMSNPEAMDAAQVARNIAEHKGFTTLFVRPFSLYLVQKTAAERFGPAPAGDLSDRSQIRGMHPDLANPPVYPLLLAGLMKVAPCKYQVAGSKSALWNNNGQFWRYKPDFIINLFNQFLFLLSVVVVFFLARKLFDSRVAWTSAALFLGTDLFWRFSISGLSTMLLILIFLGLAWCLVLLEQNARTEKWGPAALIGFTGVIGVLVATGMLTRYAFGWLIIPVLFFLILFLGRHRVILCLMLLASFFVVLSPWLYRNYHISHTPFGTAGYAILGNSSFFPEFRLERSLKPDFSQVQYAQLWFKLTGNTRGILQDELPKLGGNWINAFFLVGLLVTFRNPGLSRLRYFLLLCFPVLIAVQALGYTQLSVESPTLNSENLLIVLMPLLIIFGVSLFFILLDQMVLPAREFRYLIIGLFCLLACFPMVVTLVSARTNAVAYPPYHPPTIQRAAGWMQPDELIMTDIPWAVAWYGNHQAIWLTLNAQEDFFDIYDYRKPIKAVYLTPETMDSRFLSQWVRPGEQSWGSFIIEGLLKKELPPYFPLRKSINGWLPEQVFLTDKERWLQPATP